MSDRQQPETDAAHGVHAASREDGGAQEAPTSDEAADQEWAEATETGADAT